MPSDKIILHVGSHLDDFTNKGELLTSSENVVPGTYWTTMADCAKITNVAPYYEILKCADTIIYNADSNWNDEETKTMSEYFLHLINNEKNNVQGLKDNNNFIKYLNLIQTRQSNDPCLFLSGCSITAGTGVDVNQSYGHLIGKEIGLDVVNLAIPGSGLEAQADQILRSDIRKDDIVIWGLTNEWRRSDFNINLGHQPFDRKTFNKHNLYISVTNVYEVINFCNKLGVRLILLPILCTPGFQIEIMKEPNYVQLPYHARYIDLGTDKKHPGPRQHQSWADYIMEKCFAKRA